MNKYLKVGLGLMAGVAAGLAIYGVMRRRRRVMLEARPPFAEAAESGEA